MSSRPEALRFIALAGPTASGKTAAALALVAHARALGAPPIEIVSVDSALVYRGMDIGTAKPSAAERAQAPHHLIDIRDPARPYSAGEFVADARALIAEIGARGALPLLVGGTMMYFKALIDGMDSLPVADPVIRAELDARAAALGWPALHAELAQVDPVTAARLAPHDAQRIQRALEVWQSTGQTLSSLQLRTQREADTAHIGAAPDHVLISLEPRSRAWLHDRIAQRFDAMLAAGLIDEVRGLRERTDLRSELPSMRCVGYRQCWQWLDEQSAAAAPADAPGSTAARAGSARPATPGGAASAAAQRHLARLREQGIAATRQLAKRQLTWLRSLPQRHTLASDEGDPAQRLCLALTPLLLAWPAAQADLLQLGDEVAP
ncbi:MAG: tRNA ((37)-N6)-dimethylallyltransferase MiaA [Pseudomonadota bacterium]